MPDSADDGRLNPDSVEEYFAQRDQTAFRIGAVVDATIELDPPRQEVRLIAPAVGATPDLASYERIGVERIDVVGRPGDWFRLTVDATRMHYEAYVLAVSIVDQLDSGASFRHAVSESLSGLRNLLSSRRRMSDEQEAGLIGELLVFRHVMQTAGEDAAVAAWLGPRAEEHDFGFAGFDAEVKTTRSESRLHMIGSESQLQPSPGRVLYLVSVQLTPAGEEGDGAFGLPSLVSDIRSQLDRGRRAFEGGLERVGWVDGAADLYRTVFRLRSQPRAYLVDDGFPAITGARLDAVVPQRTLISRVSYRVDVTHLPHVAVSTPLSAFCEEPS